MAVAEVVSDKGNGNGKGPANSSVPSVVLCLVQQVFQSKHLGVITVFAQGGVK